MGKNNVMKGIFFSGLAAVLWGISGNVMQFVSQKETLPTEWFFSVRTLFAGIILLIIGAFQEGSKMFDVFKEKSSIIRLVIYSIFGLGANMSTFYISIQHGNAAAATILQYLAPLFIVLYGVIFQHKKPLKTDLIVFVFALIGVFLSITKGDFSQLSIPLISIVFGLFSAISAGVYYSVPKPLMKEHSPFVILGWGTIIAGILFNIYRPFWVNPPHLTPGIVFGIGGIILIGTILAFSSMLYSLRFATSEVSSMTDAIEPVATFIIGIIFLHLEINLIEVLGSVIVLVAIYFLQRSHQKRPNSETLDN